MITRKQIALVHVAKARLGLDDETYRAVLFRHGGGATSAKDLDHDGFAAVMAYFESCGFKSDWNKRNFGRRPGMASPEQAGLIRSLWAQWSEDGDEAGLNRWLENKFGCSALRFATPEIAHKAITALRHMTARKRQAAGAGDGHHAA